MPQPDGSVAASLPPVGESRKRYVEISKLIGLGLREIFILEIYTVMINRWDNMPDPRSFLVRWSSHI
jgi:hypothetical protein